ncbi:MAG: outer membrane protein transport protein [Verrucomicrobiales bacterium]|nr:outer membrane protein transport protein [Verrucomicrobiales bacterium]
MPLICAALGFLVSLLAPAYANGLYRNGIGARSMALGGADVAWAEGPLGALGANPATLGLLENPALDIGVIGVVPEGTFQNSTNPDSSLRDSVGALPDFAFGTPLGKLPVGIGIGFDPEAALQGDWRFVDAPGGADGKTTFGLQNHNSEILLLRSALGVGAAVGSKVWIGGSVGLLYNENSLEVPYVFQSHPQLRGLKTLLNLEADGYGWNGHVGLLFRPTENWQFGVSYKSESTIQSHGDAFGNAAAQLTSLGGAFANVRPDFHYDAQVENVFPQTVSLGASWQAHPQWRGTLQIDWINWGDAFVNLPIELTSGDNADLNSFLSSDSITDVVPLRWRDQFVYRAGIEFAVTESLALRAGYCFGESPIPSEFVTPLTAAIAEHTATVGLGYRRGRYHVDVAYQYDLPNRERVVVSGYQSGEYANSSVEVGLHWIGLTTGIRF